MWSASPVQFAIILVNVSPNGAMHYILGYTHVGNGSSMPLSGTHESITFVGPTFEEIDHAYWRDREENGHDSPV
jgi:hypothetical protein